MEEIISQAESIRELSLHDMLLCETYFTQVNN